MGRTTRWRQLTGLTLAAAAATTAAGAGFGYVWWLGPMAYELLGPRATAFSATLYATYTPLMFVTAVLLAIAVVAARRHEAGEPAWIRTAVRSVVLAAAGIGAAAVTARWWFPWVINLLRN